MPRSSLDPVVIENLNAALQESGRTAYSVATALGRPPNWLYQVINGKDGILLPTLREVAAELGVSVGELVDPPSNGSSRVTEPTPVDDRAREAEERAQEAEARIRREEARNREELEAALERTEEELERLRARVGQVATDGLTDETEPDAKPISVHRLQTAAGSGAFDLDDTVKTFAYFRSEWLFRKGLAADRCNIIGVAGESMEPTLPDGCVILVDRNRTKRYRGHIFVVRTEDGLMVKRASKDEGGGWQLVSDHPEWKPQPWPYGAEVIGEVKWMAREL